MEIPKKLKDEIWDYCRANDISGIDEFIQKMVKQGFNIEKYGTSPFGNSTPEPEIIEKEVIKEVEKIVEKRVEVTVEVPVEVIKEVEVEKIVEKRIEVPVEKVVVKEVVKEVPVEVIKEVYITDDEQVGELTAKIDSLNRKISDLGSEIEQKDEEIDRVSTQLEIFTTEFNELDGEMEELKKKLEEKPKEVVDEKYKKFWEDEVEAHEKTKERIKELEDIIKHLQGKTNDDSDIYGSDNKGWWDGGSNIFRKK